MVLAESKNRVGLGRALMNARGVSKNQSRRGQGTRSRNGLGPGGDGSVRYTTEIPKEYGSITEQAALDEFLATAELADTDFTAERMNYITVVHNSQQNPFLLTPEQEKIAVRKQNTARKNLTVPRRPAWDEHTTPTELDRLERDSFLQWRRGLAELQENLDLLMTPFERNLEMWRQLWRVIERSDLIVQIVDARNPLMFRSEDLEKYVQEVDKKKRNLLLVNKADMMTYKQRLAWADYFEKEGIQYKFFSAHLAKEELEKAELAEEEFSSEEEDEELAEETKKLELKEEEKEEFEDDRTRILKIDELEDLFLSNTPDITGDRKVTIGLVGYPNVGKSSTINALIGSKKVSVSATPGKTKHFQTIHLSPSVILCDCPGLVFPNFATTKAELVVNGILPIDQLREFTGPAALVAKRIPKDYLEALYGIKIEVRPLDEGGTGIPTAEELLVAYAKARGFTKTSAGQPDESRAARYILKDMVNGKLLFVHPPPSDPPTDPSKFNEEHFTEEYLPAKRQTGALLTAAQHQQLQDEAFAATGSGDEDFIPLPVGQKTQNVDKQFFTKQAKSSSYVSSPFKGAYVPTGQTASGKPLSGRKARAMLAAETGMTPEEVRRLTSNKKHFKGKRKM